MNKLSKKDYEYDFDYTIKFLKENSPYAHIINFDKIEKQKEKVCNVNNIVEFYDNISNLYWLGLNYKKTGHNGPYCFYKNYYKKFCDKDEIHYEFLEKYKNIIFSKEDYNKIKNKKINKNEYNKIKKEEKIYDCRIIKDNKNNNCIYIKIKTMDNPNKKQYDDLKNFLIKNKEIENIYIDIRKNTGGDFRCYEKLLKLIYNKKIKYYNNNIKIYYKYTKYNKIWYDRILKCVDKNDIKKSSNKNFTHYIIQKLNDKELYYNNKDYIGFNGHIFIIMDKFNFSSAQMLLDETKNNEGFTLLGNEKSGGSGIIGSLSCENLTPFFFILPKTKILFMYEYFYYNNSKYLTDPDKPIPIFLMKKEFLN